MWSDLCASCCPDLVLGVLGEMAQLSELQLNTCDFSHRAVRRPPGGVRGPLPDVDVRVRDLRGGSERRHQSGTEVFL